MDLSLTGEQVQLVDAVADLLAKHADPNLVRAAEPLGFDPALWDRLLELGLVAMSLDESSGGWGATALDLALVAEQIGRYVAPAPVVEAQVAARLLQRLESPQATKALQDIIEGNRLITLALHPTVDGRAALVPVGAVADAAVVLDGDRLLLVPLEGRRTGIENLGSMPIADVTVAVGDSDIELLAAGEDALSAFDSAIDDFLVLGANALVGIGARALEIGVEYVKVRKAWEVPIGSFQSVAHQLADSATAIDGARLLAQEAACAATDQPERFAELAALAFAFAYEAARDTTARSLHFHGGYGFMLEYDVQLYYRRARAWANIYSEPRRVYQRAAQRRYSLEGAR
jgi:alkylation response protein AidB-like acyl-CoA dehydrogenase